MRKPVVILLLLALLLSGCGGGSRAEARTRTVLAMDTVMTLTVYGADSDRVLDAAERELHRLDALLARGQEGSAVYAFNHGEAPEDATFSLLLETAEDIRASTDGAFDPYLGAVLDAWGFGSGAGEHRVPTQAELDAAPRLLDLGGIAKGWAGQAVQGILAEEGVTGAVLDLGGDVSLLGGKPDGSPWRVAVKDPEDTASYLGILETPGGCAVMTSGVYERYFEQGGRRWHHILDPKTGYPAQSALVSATVICEYGVWADALATAACVLGADGALALRARLADRIPFELILVTDTGQVLYTCDCFTPAKDSYRFERVT